METAYKNLIENKNVKFLQVLPGEDALQRDAKKNDLHIVDNHDFSKLKIALVQDWLTIIGGSEKVFTEISKLFPQADIFTLVAKDETIKELGFNPVKVHTSFIQKLPFAKTKYRAYLPLFPLAIEQFDLSEYDLVISSSHAVSKGVLTHANQVHICYCHSPMRYAWDLHHQYMKEAGLNKGIKGFLAKFVLHNIRQWDINSNFRVDYFVSNSNYIGNRIKKLYNRDSKTIYPNVAIEDFQLEENKDDYYFTCSRFVPYKKIDLIVKAFADMPDKKLIVIGDGPDFEKVKKIATPNVELMGFQPHQVLRKYMSKAKAMVFAAVEDFGIVPVEAQACGTPVIAFGKGGVTESVINGVTGVFYPAQTVDSIQAAIVKFENITFDPKVIRKNAEKFGTARFAREFLQFVKSKTTGLFQQANQYAQTV
jgi:glycosyltransferase involved in cell wall biosynthesis